MGRRLRIASIDYASLAIVGLLAIASSPAMAAGGAGAKGATGLGGAGGPGGSGGVVGVPNGSGQLGGGHDGGRGTGFNYNAGGGGGGGASGNGVGGAGGRGAGGAGPGGAGGSGASGGAAGQNGTTPGASDQGGGGGGGGQGGANGGMSAGPITIGSPVVAGAGGVGGNGGDANALPAGGGGGGGGGEGGIGFVGTGSNSFTNSSKVTGGDGGAAGIGGGISSPITSVHGGNGGNGGDGGIGISITASGATLTNSGTIQGGDGGAGGTGGTGGTFGSNGSNGAGGLGGAGVSGSDLTILNSGLIAGGVSASGTQANAITFTGGNNVLTLQPGWALTGNIGVTGSLTFNQSTAVILPNVITGAGSVIQNGSGTLTLSGDNIYSGGTTISTGTLQIGNGGTTGSILGNVTDNAILTFDRSDSTSFGGNISGGGVLQQNGTGTLTLSGINSYGGGTFLNSGTLAVSSDANLGAPSGGLTFNGGTLQLLAGFTSNRDVTLNAGGIVDTNGNNATWAGAVAGAGGLTKIGTGILTLSGAGTYLGPTFVNAGTLQAGIVNAFAPGSAYTVASGAVLDLNSFNQTIGSLAGGGNVTLGSATLSTGNDNTSTNFSGDISGVGGGLTKIGTGTFTLSGTSTYSGTTNVVGGTLVADGSIANSAFTVQSGAVLGGPGTIGALTAQSGATVAPGLVTPFTQLNVAGNASFAAGSTFLVNVNGANRNDRLQVGGRATLSGGTVDVLASGTGFTPSTRFTLLSATRGVSGTFAQLVTTSNLAQAFAFLKPALSYDANDVFLGFAQTTNFASVALTPNQIATAAAIQALGLGNPIYNAVVGQSFAGARQAFDALSGEVHASAVTAALEDSRLPREAILDRLSQPFYAPVPAAMAAYAADLPAKAAAAMPRYQPPQTLNFWAQGFGDFGRSGSDGNAAALSRTTDGFVLGGDASLIGLAGGDWRFGAAGGYTFDNLAIDQRLSSGNFQSVFAGVYGGASFGAVQLRSGAIYGVNSTATSRQIIFPGFGESATSNYGGSTTQAFGEAGYRVGFTGFNLAGLSFSRAMLEPYLGAAAIHLHQDGFNETGGVAALTGFGQGYDFATATLGLRGETTLAGPLPFTARALLGWRHAYGDVVPTVLMAFQGGTQAFGIAGVPIDRDALVTEAGLDYAATSAITLGVAYSGQYGERATDNAIKGHLEFRF